MTRSSQSTPVTLEQKSRRSAGSTRKNLATATACSLSIKSECCCEGLPFCTISTFAPDTAASMRDLISSKDSINASNFAVPVPAVEIHRDLPADRDRVRQISAQETRSAARASEIQLCLRR